MDEFFGMGIGPNWDGSVYTGLKYFSLYSDQCGLSLDVISGFISVYYVIYCNLQVLLQLIEEQFKVYGIYIM